jgi:Tol biopolymer transport system component
MIGSGEISEFSATFSPDGESIIFAREPGGAQVGGQAGYYRMRLSDRETSMLDDLFQMHVSISPVDWSASGEWAIYHDEQGLNREVARIRADGSGAEQLTNHEAEDLYPAWSPPMSLVWRGWVNALAGVVMLFVWMAVAARENFSRTG